MAKPHSKTQKGIDNNIRLALNDVCEQALGTITGFQWLTHQANYNNFPASLLITCVFDTDSQQKIALQDDDGTNLKNIIQAKLLKIGIKLNALKRQVIFDSEESCERQHQGDWSKRLTR
jgi:hypothetical protein